MGINEKSCILIFCGQKQIPKIEKKLWISFRDMEVKYHPSKNKQKWNTHTHTHKKKTHKDKMSSKNVKSGYLWEIGAAIFCNMLYLVLYTVCVYSR